MTKGGFDWDRYINSGPVNDRSQREYEESKPRELPKLKWSVLLIKGLIDQGKWRIKPFI